MTSKNKLFTAVESLIDLQQASCMDMRRVLHNKSITVDTIYRVSSQIKRKLLTKSSKRMRKINVLAHKFTSVGHKSSLIVLLNASADSEAAPVSLSMNLVEL